VRSVDTNVLARFLVRDDPAQTAIADGVMGSEVMLTATVLLETAWLLASRYGQSRAQVAGALTEVIRMNNVAVGDAPRMLWAIGRMAKGADFADMLHLIESRDAGRFTTFDRALARNAGGEAPIEIETLGSKGA
jgi:predicted nucleic-acid-binding protein